MVDDRAEAVLRKMLEHILRGELDDFYGAIEAAGEQVAETAATLAILASGYIAVDVPSRWPTGADVRALAKNAADTPGTQVTEDEIREYLTRVVLGGESPLTVFEAEGNRAALIPLFATADLLVSFSGQHETHWKYLDAIWNALDATETLDATLAPAVTFLFGRRKK